MNLLARPAVLASATALLTPGAACAGTGMSGNGPPVFQVDPQQRWLHLADVREVDSGRRVQRVVRR